MMKKIKSFNSFINENYKVNNITEQDIVDCIKAGGVIYSEIVSEYSDNENWEKEPLTPFDIEDGRIGVKIEGNPHYVNLEDVKRVEWNEDKRLSELFDTEELKNSQEIDFLSGNIDKKELIKTAVDKLSPVENLLYKLKWDAPFIDELSPFGSEKELWLKKDDTVKFTESDVVSFIIEILIGVNKIDEYTMSYKIETIGNGQSMFKRIEHFGVMDYKELIDKINSTLLDDIIEWNRESEQIFKRTPLKNASKRLLKFNNRFN
jgi:hypothetical protein